MSVMHNPGTGSVGLGPERIHAYGDDVQCLYVAEKSGSSRWGGGGKGNLTSTVMHSGLSVGDTIAAVVGSLFASSGVTLAVFVRHTSACACGVSDTHRAWS